eukprot:gene10133-24789_t
MQQWWFLTCTADALRDELRTPSLPAEAELAARGAAGDTSPPVEGEACGELRR